MRIPIVGMFEEPDGSVKDLMILSRIRRGEVAVLDNLKGGESRSSAFFSSISCQSMPANASRRNLIVVVLVRDQGIAIL